MEDWEEVGEGGGGGVGVVVDFAVVTGEEVRLDVGIRADIVVRGRVKLCLFARLGYINMRRIDLVGGVGRKRED